MTTTSTETRMRGERVIRGVLVANGFLLVLFLAAGGWFIVGLEAQSVCTPDGNDAPCPRAAILPWVQVGGQALVLLGGLALLRWLVRRSLSPAGRVCSTLGAIAATQVAAVLVLLLLLRAASW